ncbi:MAG: hypothetical protein K8S54_18720 [Spirochaetia bacterium]|nr:hypothetical protein [Spirochaetia bacterium]
MQSSAENSKPIPPEIQPSLLDFWAAKLRGLLWLPPILLIGLALAVKLSFYFSSEPLTGWDTPGQLHMARTYNEFFSTFDSIGYDHNWFLGFPAFYFYPPFLYFCIAQIRLLTGSFLPFEFAFNVGMFFTLIFFCFAYLKLSLLLLTSEPKPETDSESARGRFAAMILAALGLVWYLSYPGDGLQGTALVGFLGGTVVGTFAHGLILMALYFLETFRRNRSYARAIQFMITAGLVAYTHALSTVFFTITLILYFFILRKSFSARTILVLSGVPLLLAAPIFLLFARYSAYSSGVSIVTYYPPVLSILGTDFYERISEGGGLLRQILAGFKWLNLVVILLFVFQIGRAIAGKIQISLERVLLSASLLLLWIATDTSLAFIFPTPGVHWYRAFDLAWGIGTMVAIAGVARTSDKSNAVLRVRLDFLLLALFTISFGRFLFWDPVSHEKYESMRLYGHTQSTQQLEVFLQSLPQGTVILPEKIRGRKLFGSPHFFDYLIRKYGHRNALGLMVESSLGPIVTYGYLLRSLPETFVWGIDARKATSIYSGYNADELPEFLRRSGVHNLLGHSPYLQSYATTHPRDLKLVFADEGMYAYEVLKTESGTIAWPDGPIGFLTLARIKGGPGETLAPADFLVAANQVRLRMGQAPPLIHLDPVYGTREFAIIARRLAGLVIYNDGRILAPSGILGTSVIDKPLFLVNFQQTESGPTARYIYTSISLPPNVIRLAYPTPPPHFEARATLSNRKVIEILNPSEQNSHACVSVNRGFFPDWSEIAGIRVYQTETNGMLVCPNQPRATLEFSNVFSKPITCIMYLLTGLLLLTCALGQVLEGRWRRIK